MKPNAKIFVAGHTGLLGSSILRQLNKEGFTDLLTAERNQVNYCDFSALEAFFRKNRPEYVFLAAGKTGGIQANKTYPADFIYENLAIQNNFFRLCAEFKVKSLVYFASSCIYPKNSPKPIKEVDLFTGPIEPTSQAYAAAKIAGLLGCQAYNIQFPETKMICLLPNSLYGPNDNFSLAGSHVLAALIRKIHDAKTKQQAEVMLWGSGAPKREFIYTDDAGAAAIFALKNYQTFENSHYNVGTGTDYSIEELAKLIAGVVGYSGTIKFDATKPDGAPKKLLDSSKFSKLGWSPEVSFSSGLEKTYRWFQAQPEFKD